MTKKRGPGRPPGRTEQGEETREALYTAAVLRFAEHGYDGTTMAAIARDAGVSPGLLYKYFDGKQAVVLELYRRASRDYHVEYARRGGLPEGSWAERTVAAVRGSLSVLEPHRTVLRGVLPQLLSDQDGGLLSPASAAAREQVFAVYTAAITGARDAPSAPLDHTLARIGYLLQLSVLLFWVLERSPDQRATRDFVGVLGRVLPTAAVGLWVPGVSATLHQLADLADSLVEPALGTVAGEGP